MIYWIALLIITGIFLCMFLSKLSYYDIIEEYPHSGNAKTDVYQYGNQLGNQEAFKFIVDKKRLPVFITSFIVTLIFYRFMQMILFGIINLFTETAASPFTKYQNFISLSVFIMLYFLTNLVIIRIHFQSIIKEKMPTLYKPNRFLEYINTFR